MALDCTVAAPAWRNRDGGVTRKVLGINVVNARRSVDCGRRGHFEDWKKISCAKSRRGQADGEWVDPNAGPAGY
jgi:hypothetical protein